MQLLLLPLILGETDYGRVERISVSFKSLNYKSKTMNPADTVGSEDPLIGG